VLRRIAGLLGLVSVFACYAFAQTKPAAPAAPKDASPWFLLTGPKQVTPTRPASTPHFNQMVTFTNTPPNGTFNVSYGPFQFTTTGQSTGSTLNFSLNTDEGNVPPNLMLSQSGLLSGVPVQTGTYNFQVFVDDQQGDFGSMNFSITIGLAVSGTPPSDI